MKNKITALVDFFNHNYTTNHSTIIHYLNSYIHSSHCICSKKMDGYNVRYQPSFPNVTVVKYEVYYDDTMKSNHHSGRIMLHFSDGTMDDIGLFRFKKYLRRFEYYKKPNECIGCVGEKYWIKNMPSLHYTRCCECKYYMAIHCPSALETTFYHDLYLKERR